jgi:uncharacterized membrane protein YeaQ/YmgE (transglycosylase-associated protein family)
LRDGGAVRAASPVTLALKGLVMSTMILPPRLGLPPSSAKFTLALIDALMGYPYTISNVFGGTMTITGIISAILIGLVIGALGRLVVPGKQRIPIWLTILVGIGAAFLGTALARAMGIPTATEGIDWLELLVQVVVAAIGVGIVAAVFGKRRSGILRR